jgi:hypothetical protein
VKTVYSWDFILKQHCMNYNLKTLKKGNHKSLPEVRCSGYFGSC